MSSKELSSEQRSSEGHAEAADGLPLEGVRVLSQAIVWAGPAASLILADLGAEVIEIESIQHLNPTRTHYRNLPELIMQGASGALYVDRDPSEGFWNRNAHFNHSKRGHKSLTLDIDRPEGLELLRELVRVSDVYIENNAASVVEKFGLDYPQLAELNPRIVMARFPGFGTTGPYRSFKGFAPHDGRARRAHRPPRLPRQRPLVDAGARARRPQRRHPRRLRRPGRAVRARADWPGPAHRPLARRGGAAPHLLGADGLLVQRAGAGDVREPPPLEGAERDLPLPAHGRRGPLDRHRRRHGRAVRRPRRGDGRARAGGRPALRRRRGALRAPGRARAAARGLDRAAAAARADAAAPGRGRPGRRAAAPGGAAR